MHTELGAAPVLQTTPQTHLGCADTDILCACECSGLFCRSKTSSRRQDSTQCCLQPMANVSPVAATTSIVTVSCSPAGTHAPTETRRFPGPIPGTSTSAPTNPSKPSANAPSMLAPFLTQRAARSPINRGENVPSTPEIHGVTPSASSNPALNIEAGLSSGSLVERRPPAAGLPHTIMKDDRLQSCCLCRMSRFPRPCPHSPSRYSPSRSGDRRRSCDRSDGQRAVTVDRRCGHDA